MTLDQADHRYAGPAASRKPAAPKSAWGDKYGAASHSQDSAAARGDASSDTEPSERPKLHARVPKALSRPSSAKPPAAPASAARGADDDGKGYLSDPGAAGGENRPRASPTPAGISLVSSSPHQPAPSV